MAVEGVLAAGGTGATVGRRQRRGSGQVVTGQQRIEARIRLQRPGAIRRIGQARIQVGTSVRIQADRVERRIDDSESVVFRQNCVRVGDSHLDVVNALDIGHVGAQPQIREPAILADGLKLKIRDEVGKRIAARVVVVLILPRETAEGKHGVRIQ